MSTHVLLVLVMDGLLSFPDAPQDSTVPMQSPEHFTKMILSTFLSMLSV